MGTYPTREEHTRLWEQLAREISESKQHIADSSSKSSPQKGTLIVLGSGIQGVSFTMEAEPYLRMADRVFYCVSNPPTQVWLHKLRPDAYDLYVLYDDTKPRYHTYVQMSEAILHYVRKGERVVTVFYGHPGIFVFSTHRAIAIARREGHYAVMKAGISALDCLCADLGVDPAFPGMQTFEATEALVRNRWLDTSTHVVLWQVGLIGDTGYRRKGFINDKFPIFAEYLERFYGADYTVTHYVAARHHTFEPTIAVHKISELLDPRVRATFTGISTFYIAPKDTVPTDGDMARRLGFLKSGQRAGDPPRLREIALYASRELEAVAEFAHFEVPREYQFQTQTRAAEFLIELGQNPTLQDLYLREPAKAVAEDSFPGLSRLDRHLLAQRSEDWAQLAAKGSLVTRSPGERFVIDLHHRRNLARAFRSQLAAVYRNGDPAHTAGTAVEAWLTSQGYQTSLSSLATANERVNASMLLPWTGVYSTSDGSLVITIIGSPHHNSWSLVYANRTPIANFTFNNSTLAWTAGEGNPHSAELTFDIVPPNGNRALVRTISGVFWEAGQQEPSAPNLQATEVGLANNPLSVWTGRYSTLVTRDGVIWTKGPMVRVVTPRPDQSPSVSHLILEDRPVEAEDFQGTTLSWGDNQITFSQDEKVPGRNLLSGRLQGYWAEGVNVVGTSMPDDDTPFRGGYAAYLWSDSQWQPVGDFSYDLPDVRFGEQPLEQASFERNVLQWSSRNGVTNHGSLQFFIDPTTQIPKFIGYLWRAGAKPEHPNLLGVYSFKSTAGLRPPLPVGASIPPPVWDVLAAIGLEGKNPGCHFLWSRWQRARFTCRVSNRLLTKVSAAAVPTSVVPTQ